MEILADVFSLVHSLPGDPSSVWVASLPQRREVTAEALAGLGLKKTETMKGPGNSEVRGSHRQVF